MAKNESNVEFQSDETSWMGLPAHALLWTANKVSADQLGLDWAAIQGKYYEGERSVKYVTKDSIIACNCGTFFSRINMPVDHGVETRETHLPILTVDDFGSQNIPSFGDCSLKFGQDSITCIPSITQSWTQEQVTASADNAKLLKADAFAVCNVGGTISVKEVNTTPRESLMAVLKEQYGFDEKTTRIILKVYQAVQDNKDPYETQMMKDWRFACLLGGLKYTLSGKEKLVNVTKWKDTAGDATNGMNFKTYMTEKLGLSGEDYEYLQYKVRIQYYLVDKDADATKYKMDLDYDTVKKEYINNMSTGLGHPVEKDEFINTWNQQCNDMCGMTDFAHQQITTAAMLATDASKNGVFANLYVGGDENRELMAGWLGDATLGDPPSFKNDDYKADLDAENIVLMVRNEGYTYIKALADYYDRRLLEDNRAKLFLENNNFNDVKWQIYEKVVYIDYLHKMSHASGSEEQTKLTEAYKYENESSWMQILKDIAPDSYNFIRSLEKSLPEMGEF